MKIKVAGAYVRRRKQKKKNTEFQSYPNLGLSLRGNPYLF